MNKSVAKMQFDNANVQIYPSSAELGGAAATQALSLINDAIQNRKRARIIVGTGNSQESLIESLVKMPELDWKKVEVFHMDEYVGMNPTHPASFRLWLKTKLVDFVQPGQIHYLHGDAPDIELECERYGRLLAEATIDLSFVGFGENGHIAFNDPHVADFQDPRLVKPVALDEKCRMQQVGEGHFPDLRSVPTHALTITCPVLLKANYMICSVPERRKAEAVHNALKGPISSECPASFVRTHPRAYVYLDTDSAHLL
jgi:glucosamine-6-phosphate deaminase